MLDVYIFTVVVSSSGLIPQCYVVPFSVSCNSL